MSRRVGDDPMPDVSTGWFRYVWARRPRSNSRRLSSGSNQMGFPELSRINAPFCPTGTPCAIDQDPVGRVGSGILTETFMDRRSGAETNDQAFLKCGKCAAKFAVELDVDPDDEMPVQYLLDSGPLLMAGAVFDAELDTPQAANTTTHRCDCQPDAPRRSCPHAHVVTMPPPPW